MRGVPRIRPLPEEVAARIAAGEVVERPASVVKELVENSIDAKATLVEITTESGGKSLVKVADDGEGMDGQEALIAVQRHTTSKLFSLDDLDRLTTLGFRGEALFAISSVSRFSLTTRREDQSVGVRIWVENGEVVDVQEAARQRGTTVEVRDLFFNLPARRRFLRSDNTELGHVVKVVEWYLLSRPSLGVSLVNDDREIFTYPPMPWEERVSSHWEIDQDHLVPVGFKAPGIEVRGFVTEPGTFFKSRAKMVFSVNGHPVQDAVLSAAVREAMGGLMPRGEYPGLLLLITLPPREVDVNVHPTKREVRFRNGQLVFRAVVNALKKALSGKSCQPAEQAWTSDSPVQIAEGRHQYQQGDTGGGPAVMGERCKTTTLDRGYTGVPSMSTGQALSEQGKLLEPSNIDSWAYLGEVEGVYLVLETPDRKLIVVDKHACHERMLYEEIVKDNRPPVALLTPLQVKLSAEEVEAAEANMDMLNSLGFSFEIHHGKVSLKAVPTWARGHAEEAFRKTLELKGEEERREALARWACRHAVKAGDTTVAGEVEALVSWIEGREGELTCPHGRPIVLRLTKELLDRLFKRRM